MRNIIRVIRGEKMFYLYCTSPDNILYLNWYLSKKYIEKYSKEFSSS